MKNCEELPVHPCDINGLLLAQSYLDLKGYIPLFEQKGFSGEIYLNVKSEMQTP